MKERESSVLNTVNIKHVYIHISKVCAEIDSFR